MEPFVIHGVLSLNLRYSYKRERPRSAHNLLIPALLMPPPPFFFSLLLLLLLLLYQSPLYSPRACFERTHRRARPQKSIYIIERSAFLLPLSPLHPSSSSSILLPPTVFFFFFYSNCRGGGGRKKKKKLRIVVLSWPSGK